MQKRNKMTQSLTLTLCRHASGVVAHEILSLQHHIKVPVRYMRATHILVNGKSQLGLNRLKPAGEENRAWGRGLVWCGVWFGVVWCGVVWCGVVWCGVVCGKHDVSFVHSFTVQSSICRTIHPFIHVSIRLFMHTFMQPLQHIHVIPQGQVHAALTSSLYGVLSQQSAYQHIVSVHSQ